MTFTNVNDYAAVMQKVIPVQVCEEVIKYIETQPWEPHTWYNAEADLHSSEATLEPLVQAIDQKWMDKLHPFIMKVLTIYQDKYAVRGEKCDNQLVSTFTPPRFTKYSIGSKMRKHYDHIHSVFDGKHKGIPVISIVGNLNEDYEGAEFMLRGKEIKLKTGDILLFPSIFMFHHSVEEPKKGIRYSFQSWAF
jgi:hypothetical protein